MNIAISGIGTSVGLGILKSLRQSPKAIKIIAIDNRKSAHSYMADKYIYMDKVENLKSNKPVIKILNENKIDVILIASEYELEWYSENKLDLQNNTNTKIAITAQKWISIGNDKLKTYRFIHSLNLPVAPFFHFDSESKEWLSGINSSVLRPIDFPAYLKPLHGTSNKGIIFFDTYQKFSEYSTKFSDNLLDKVLQKTLKKTEGSFEVTSSIVIESNGTIPLPPFHAKRVLNKGISWTLERFYSKKLDDYVAHLASQMQDYSGSLNIQFIGTETDGFLPLEINTRFSGTTSFRLACKRNEVMLIVNDLLGIDSIDIIEASKVEISPIMHRYIEDYIIDTNQ